MPHIELKISSLVSEDIKQELAEQFEKDLIAIAGRNRDEISIAIDSINKEDWKNEIYDELIIPKMDDLYKKPNYKL